MRIVISLILVALTTVVVLAARAEDSDAATEAKAVTAVIDSYVEALEAENVEALMRLFAKDPDLATVNVHLPGIVKGPKKVAAVASEWFGAVEAVDVEIREKVVKLNAAANVAWVSFVLDQSSSIPGSSERYSFPGMRVTWGLEKRDGEYVIVQAHWSFRLKS